MFVFGHTGITTGIAMIADAATYRRRARGAQREAATGRDAKSPNRRAVRAGKFLPVKDWMDYRWLVVGSLLPDIIDKPLGQYILREQLGYGRVYAHSALFLLALGIPGMWLFRRWGNSWLLILALGSLMHQLEDQMWRWPEVWFWPTRGVAFPREDLNGWIPRMMTGLATEPKVYIPEIIGIAFLAIAAVRVFRNRRFVYALRTGHAT